MQFQNHIIVENISFEVILTAATSFFLCSTTLAKGRNQMKNFAISSCYLVPTGPVFFYEGVSRHMTSAK